MKTLTLSLRQTPFLLRAFFRQGNQVFWNYGFFLLLLIFACSLLAATDPQSLRPMLGSAVMALSLMAGGVFGVSYGLWNFFRGGVVERYWRSPRRGAALGAYLASRFLVLISAVAVQILVLLFLYGVGKPPEGVPWSVGGADLWALVVAAVLAGAVFVAFGLCMVTLARAHFRSYFLSNLTFIALVVFSGALLPLELFPPWGAAIGRFLPSAHLMAAFQAVLAGGAGFGEVWQHLAMLASWLLLLIAVAWRTFDWMVLERAR